MSIEHKKIELTGDVEVIEVNVMFAIMKLSAKGELKISRDPCSGETTMSIGDYTVTRRSLNGDATGYISPIALCLCDLLDLVRAENKPSK